MGGSLAYSLGCASVPKAPTPAAPPTSATAGSTTIVAIAPAPQVGPTTTLPQLLGLPQLARGVGGVLQRIGSRLLNGLDLTGRFPGLQPTPPVLALTDPANLADTAPPAVQAAAEIKQEEDSAPQKIMAIRYLATLGCGGCYEKVEDALLEGLSDCTEAVRFEAVKALQCKQECGCKFCSSPSCCSANVRKKLEELTQCEKEPSARIRRNARLTLECCGTVPLQSDDAVPREGPTPAGEPEGMAALTRTRAGNEFFEGIQLVSFESLLAPNSPSDMILAQVNGEAIYESQVLPLVEQKLRKQGNLASSPVGTMDTSDKRAQLAVELRRVIDWKLLEQSAKNDVYPASTAASPIGYSPEEIQAWFERKIHFDSFVAPQQLIAHYEIHREEFKVSAKIRWERISVLLDRCSSHEQALAVSAYLRDWAIGGTREPPAGFHREMVESESSGWSDLDKIEPRLIRQCLKSLQTGQISATIESPESLQLVRVLERSNAEYLPLPMVADQIQRQILLERRKQAEVYFVDRLRAESQIWTVFDLPAKTINATHATVGPVLRASGQQESVWESIPARTTGATN